MNREGCSPRSRLMALVGPGRSGTTWAGTLVDSSPDVIYRFEPFHRLRLVDPEIKMWFQKLRKQEVLDKDLPSIYERLRLAHPLTSKAPFFGEKAYAVRNAGRSIAWPVARTIPGCGRIYGAIYTPPAGPPIVFKEVTFIQPLRNFVQKTSLPVVYVVRHPCATVMSTINVQMEEGVPARVRHLRRTLADRAPELAERYADVLTADDLVSQVALLWRYEVETCVTLIRESAHGMILTYEQLADDAYTNVQLMFRHYGIAFGASTERFLDSLHSLQNGSKVRPRRTGWGSRDFSVYRNPKEQKDSWKNRISAVDRSKIESIVQGVPAIEHCAALGRWW